MSNTITIEIPDGKRAEWVDGVLTLVDEAPTPKDITERVKTFEDAMNILGKDHPLVQRWLEAPNGGEKGKYTDVWAYLKLCIITAALNEGWEPEFTEDEERWFPWFFLYTQKEIDKMSEKKRSRVVLRSGNYSYAASGFAYASAHNACSYSSAYYGARLAFRTERLADYAGTQFAALYADFYFRPE